MTRRYNLAIGKNKAERRMILHRMVLIGVGAILLAADLLLFLLLVYFGASIRAM